MVTQSPLNAGIAEVDITAGAGVELAGDLCTTNSTGIDTPLTAKALVLSDGRESVALVALDLWGLSPADVVTTAIADSTGLRPESIMLASSHTRGAPCTAPAVGCSGPADEYLSEIVPRIASAVAQAQSQLQDASIGVGHAQLPHLVYNHRLLTRNLKAVSAWLDLPRNEVLAPEGPVDPGFDVVVVRDAGGDPLCFLWVFAADNRFPSGSSISAGLPHCVQRELDARLQRRVPCLYFPGCGGDVSFTGDLTQTADAVASAVMAVQLETPADPVARLACARERAVLPIRDYSQHWSRPDIELKCPEAVERFAREVELLQQEGARAVPTSIQVLRIGRLALVGLPGMPFVELALQIKCGSPFGDTIVAGNINDGLGPIPTRHAFDNEGFEAWPSRAARVGPGAGEFMAAEAIALLRELHRSRRMETA